MKNLLLFLLFIFFTSCNYFDKKVPSEKELLTKELKEINWNQVDEYPTIVDCEKLTDKAQKKQCFFEFLSATIQEKLTSEKVNNLYLNLDTINVKVTVLPNAQLQFEPQFPKDSVAYDKIKIDSILKVKLVDFPKINPAMKRGIPVKTQFILPVILKSKK